MKKNANNPKSKRLHPLSVPFSNITVIIAFLVQLYILNMFKYSCYWHNFPVAITISFLKHYNIIQNCDENTGECDKEIVV